MMSEDDSSLAGLEHTHSGVTELLYTEWRYTSWKLMVRSLSTEKMKSPAGWMWDGLAEMTGLRVSLAPGTSTGVGGYVRDTFLCVWSRTWASSLSSQGLTSCKRFAVRDRRDQSYTNSWNKYFTCGERLVFAWTAVNSFLTCVSAAPHIPQSRLDTHIVLHFLWKRPLFPWAHTQSRKVTDSTTTAWRWRVST